MKRRNSFFEEENVTMRQDKGAPEVDESQQQWDEEYMEEGYLFFCLGDPATGELFYAKTNEEHEANRAKYEALWEAYDAEN